MNELAARVMANEAIRGHSGNKLNRERIKTIIAAGWTPVDVKCKRKYRNPVTGDVLWLGQAYSAEMTRRGSV